MGFVENAPVAPDGSPDTEREIDELKPPVAVVETVVFPDDPWVTVTVDGEAEMVKSGAPPHELNLNEPIRVCQLNEPFAGMYSEVNQQVQSSAGSVVMDEESTHRDRPPGWDRAP